MAQVKNRWNFSLQQEHHSHTFNPTTTKSPYIPPFQPMETPTRHSFEQATTRESPLRKLSWYKLKTAGIFLFNRNITPTPSIQPRPGDPTFPHPGIQPASTVRSQKCRKGSRRDLGFEPSLQEERFPYKSPERGQKGNRLELPGKPRLSSGGSRKKKKPP